MGRYDRKDRFYEMAKSAGHASRAYYKLEQMQKKYKIVRQGDLVVDLGAAPGGWMELLSKLIGEKGRVVGVDILPLKITIQKNMTFIKGDINSHDTIEELKSMLGLADFIVSDMAPSTSGIKFKDSYLSYQLAAKAFDISKEILKKGGNFVTKIFPGEDFAGFKKELSVYFKTVHQHRPEATRKSSTEVYLVCKGYNKSPSAC